VGVRVNEDVPDGIGVAERVDVAEGVAPAGRVVWEGFGMRV
jgi:hypothetical protein